MDKLCRYYRRHLRKAYTSAPIEALGFKGGRTEVTGETQQGNVRGDLQQDLVMGISRTEVNLRRLLAAAPQQQNRAKLIHYVATLREQLEQLTEERTLEGLPRFFCLPFFLFLSFGFKQKVNKYAEEIEAIASKIIAPLSDVQVSQEPLSGTYGQESHSKDEEDSIPHSPGLRRRFVPASNVEDRTHDTVKADASGPVKLDAAAQAHVEKHRKLQEDLTDEMVGLAKQLKQGSLLMSQSIKNSEKILDSTEKAVEHSLASTGRVNTRAREINSNGFKTTCFTWILIFVMTCIFIMVVLLIRVT
ncbi:hypothetical protein CK203_027162 [Vitis vinifera]|uniref:Vesicle transport protein USE1 n=1 Tax=Vitis vinifera TaxID=29760 RepID=A0A438I653_VITVI|nr:hypothetical protein CK203_027162 [Vitis vinifera]